MPDIRQNSLVVDRLTVMFS